MGRIIDRTFDSCQCFFSYSGVTTIAGRSGMIIVRGVWPDGRLDRGGRRDRPITGRETPRNASRRDPEITLWKLEICIDNNILSAANLGQTRFISLMQHGFFVTLWKIYSTCPFRHELLEGGFSLRLTGYGR